MYGIRWILSEDSACFDVRKYEKEQSLLIIDSGVSRWFVKQTIEHAKTTGKDGVSVISDMDSFSSLKKAISFNTK